MSNAPTPGPANRPTPPSAGPQLFGKPMGGPAVILVLLLGLAFVTVLMRAQTGGPVPISYDQFIREVEADNVSSVEIVGETVRGSFKTAPPKERIPDADETGRFSVV